MGRRRRFYSGDCYLFGALVKGFIIQSRENAKKEAALTQEERDDKEAKTNQQYVQDRAVMIAMFGFGAVVSLVGLCNMIHEDYKYDRVRCNKYPLDKGCDTASIIREYTPSERAEFDKQVIEENERMANITIMRETGKKGNNEIMLSDYQKEIEKRKSEGIRATAEKENNDLMIRNAGKEIESARRKEEQDLIDRDKEIMANDKMMKERDKQNSISEEKRVKAENEKLQQELVSLSEDMKKRDESFKKQYGVSLRN